MRASREALTTVGNGYMAVRCVKDVRQPVGFFWGLGGRG